MRHFLAILAVLAMSTAVHAEPSSMAPAMAGMKYNAGLICNHPQITYDLIKVINNEEMFVNYYVGYSAISGVCVQGRFEFTLVRKWKTTNKSYDGYNVEMWEVRMYDGDTMWAIITPDVPEHRVGTAI